MKVYLPLTDIQVFLLAFAIFLTLLHYVKPLLISKFPPGPWGWPLIGCLPSFVNNEPHRILADLGEKYGPVFSLRLGTELVVVINGYKAIREALVKKGEFCNSRPSMPIMQRTTKQLGVVNAYYGASWKEQRKFTLSVLRSFGMGKSTVEGRVTEEAYHLCMEIRKLQGEAFDPTHFMTNAIANIISSIIFGKRFEYDDPTFRRLLYLCNKNFELAGSVAISNFFPILQYLPIGPMKEIVDNFEIYRNFLNDKINEHRLNFDPNDISDVISAYLSEMDARKTTEGSSFHDDNLFAVVSDLFAAGTETASTTLRWALLYFAVFEDVQTKVQKELDDVVGRHRKPCFSDRHNLPYTEAVTLEIHRMASIVPICLPHSTIADTEIMGHKIPKDTVLIVNLWSALNDPKTWKDPDRFDPTRFLNAEGKVKRYKELIPFSIGRRVCLGEQLAKTEIFLLLTRLLHEFRISPAADCQSPTMKPVAGITLSPQPYRICAKKR
ncbi:cytochrome P450 2J2-like [Ptychodera flava]|uniref:cytochrome P450 2J2-like n=1 Tax=Ptychodera flava TaxID=63121 RepID=UPI003969DA20